jgi:adenine phosphoribosyltransferase
MTHTRPFDEATLRAHIVDVPDFPSAGIVFKDISPLLADPLCLVAVVDALATSAGPVDKVVGIEARGFILAAPVACLVGSGFVPVRKPGKLPGPTHETSYDLEYGSNVLQVHQDAFSAGERVLVVDDVLATGGTAAAAVRLVQQAGAEVVCISVLLELCSLRGRAALAAAHPEVPVSALLPY